MDKIKPYHKWINKCYIIYIKWLLNNIFSAYFFPNISMSVKKWCQKQFIYSYQIESHKVKMIYKLNSCFSKWLLLIHVSQSAKSSVVIYILFHANNYIRMSRDWWRSVVDRMWRHYRVITTSYISVSSGQRTREAQHSVPFSCSIYQFAKTRWNIRLM